MLCNFSEQVYHDAIDICQREYDRPSIPSFSESLDRILGKQGLPLGSLTEVLGLPGTGKTQLCLQLCASIQIPKALGGLSSEALFIDTNTSFTVDRFQDIILGSFQHCREFLKLDDAMKNLHYVNAFGLEKFLAVMGTLRNLVEEHRDIKLIVVDSIAFPFKASVSPKKRTGLLFRLMADLQKLAFEKQIAVVLTNEMSTRIGLSGGSMVGALGDAWAHRCNTRILLAQVAGNRHAVLMKSNTKPTAVAKFQVTHEGIRDVDERIFVPYGSTPIYRLVYHHKL